jgi:hypothetical protein
MERYVEPELVKMEPLQEITGDDNIVSGVTDGKD